MRTTRSPAARRATASSAGATSGTIDVDVSSLGQGSSSATIQVFVSTGSFGSTPDRTATITAAGSSSFTITGLAQGTAYFVKVVVTGSNGLSATNTDASFVTGPLNPPSGTLAIGFRLGECMEEPNRPAIHVFNALYGSGARRTIKGGTGSGDVNSRFYVTVEQGLENAGFTITSRAWLDAYDDIQAEAHRQFVEEIKKAAKAKHVMPALVGMGAVMPEPEYSLPLDGEGDTALYVLARNSGEGSDRKAEKGDVLLTDTEIRDILAANEKYERFMLVLNVGGPVDLTPVLGVDNILVLSQLGVVTGDALADVLLGRQAPSGKLTATWAAWPDYPTVGEYIQPEDTRYREGIYVGYRYFDSVNKTPMYPFGFGLGYTEFSLGAPAAAVEKTEVTITVPVVNTGSFGGKEVVQIYVSVPAGKLDQPYQTLAGFAKTKELAPGEREDVLVRFRLEDIASYDEDAAAWILESGGYIVRVGTDSRHTTPAAVLRLEETVTVRQVRPVGGRPDFADWKPEPRDSAIPGDLPVLPVDGSAFSGLSWPEASGPSAYAKEFVSRLRDEQLLYLCMGRFQKGSRFASIIGNASQSVAGAAGETYGGVPGISPLVMADGPAGLRLNKEYTRDKKGVHPVGSSFPAGLDEFLSPAAGWFLKRMQKKPRGEIFEQYCTAIPIGTALAQSWNTALCEACGDLVGWEMERFGVHLWLAPAFNIHRTILCGRNFEYYSEDPLLSGQMGAAITKGVQKHPGCGTTIKHFCCNNQELNRTNSNSLVSERALREIYLRAFQICIRESDPAALMTSYNLLNGAHTSEREDLLQTLLREEWGYRGLIMTDWVISAMAGKGKYRCGKAAQSIAAGNIFMPGGQTEYNQALRALHGRDREFVLSRDKARRCAAQVVDTVRRLMG